VPWPLISPCDWPNSGKGKRCESSPTVTGRNKKPEGTPIVQAVESNKALNIVIETTDSTRAIPPHDETMEGTPQEATKVFHDSCEANLMYEIPFAQSTINMWSCDYGWNMVVYCI